MGVRYPADFACPLIADYKVEVELDGERTEFEHGNVRQRRQWSKTHAELTLGFAVSWDQLFNWQTWVNRNAYEWFKIGLYSYHPTTGKMLPTEIRFISDLKVTTLTAAWAKVTVDAEFNPDFVAFIPAELTNTWIIAGSPTAPSNGRWVLANGVITPLKEYIIAGTPDSPAGSP